MGPTSYWEAFFFREGLRFHFVQGALRLDHHILYCMHIIVCTEFDTDFIFIKSVLKKTQLEFLGIV